MNELDQMIAATKADIADDNILAEAFEKGARAIFEGVGAEGTETTSLPTEMADVSGDKAKEIATAVTNLGATQDAAAEAKEAVDKSTEISERAENEAKLADADKAVADAAKTAADITNSVTTEKNEQQQQA
jgi:septal ring-binding cell division protein DamX